MPLAAGNSHIGMDFSMTKFISIRGAREHNLKNISVDIPRDKLVVITGLSGSGKSSLAFDTIYAEGQRRYVESLSAYARQFLEMMQKPDVDTIDGLSPAISIEQKTTSRNPRSTVGTVTEINDHMRLLWARAGVPHSPATGLPIESQTLSQMVDKALALPEGTRIFILAPVVRDRKGEYRKEFGDWKKQGYQRIRLDGEILDIDDLPVIDKKKKHTVEIVVDRLVIRQDQSQRIADSLEQAIALADGLAILLDPDQKSEILLSSRFACPVSGFTLPEIEPRLFSFNSPHGACPACDGLGVRLYMDPDLVVPDVTRSLDQDAIAGWSIGAIGAWYRQQLAEIASLYNVSMKTPWKDLPEDFRNAVLHGRGKFEGVLANMERRWKETDSAWMRDELAEFQSSMPCSACNGKRLKPEALLVKVAGLDIASVSDLSIREAAVWFAGIESSLSAKQREIARRILKEINDRLGFLLDVGLDYLTLSRGSATLSGGEGQRIRLASQIGSGLSGVLYVLDEPSIGLHQRDNDRLLETLRRLRDLGNTVIVVEHDEDAMRAADWLIDMGPGAGVHGGQVIDAGTPDEVAANPDSVTAGFLSGRREIALPPERRPGNGTFLEVSGATGNNLRNVTARIPLGAFTCVTGVSGSGKSTLILDTLRQGLARVMTGARDPGAPHRQISGVENIDKVIDIDQSPIGRTPRSNPATYTGAFTPIREWFAALPESKARGYGPGRFSFNVKGGRCEACQGDGVLKIEMHFLPDVYVPCDVCAGRRFGRETLEILHKGKSIADVLDMSIEEALDFFKAVPAIRNKLSTLSEVGLGYVRVGQAATTLSGGEAQRIKLANELSRRGTGKTLYILDEPTTGLHFEDVRKLLEVLQRLVDQKNSVLVIEHNLDVIKTADWLIDMGPDGGDRGGRIVVTGTPEQVAKSKKGHTARYLNDVIARHRFRTKQ